MIILIVITLIISISSFGLSIYGIITNDIALGISSLSVTSASISGLVAVLVLKANKDKERPFLMIEPNYNRYGMIQISVRNYGSEIAIIKNCEADNEINLLNDENFFKQIEQVVIPTGGSINFPLIKLDDYPKKNKELTTKGIIFYTDIEGKRFSNSILFNIEGLGPTAYNDDEERKMFYELQKVPKRLKDLNANLKKMLVVQKDNVDNTLKLRPDNMVRDVKYLYQILEEIEDGKFFIKYTEDERLIYHLILLKENEFIRINIFIDMMGEYMVGEPIITWKGHEFLNNK